ncbi:VINORINE SYNTHASE-LIKE [Salix koriyanagi]|uniref:VINORINE SYNTHASE-LIKE n=1 Tax=Salix koriyanagi TaxID=2511006 RepID=A0A9Q0PML9_9ROSI|nr:VINORINE SYNTHASE-LIKE [Salix koriyanagi]
MSMILQQPDIGQLEQLQSCKPDENVDEPCGKVMLAAQVNYFDCGGIAIVVRIRHRAGTVVDCSSLFLPQDLSCLRNPIPLKFNISAKRFVFEGPKIAALREKLCKGPYLSRPTRVEAVSALIWGAVGEDSETKKVTRLATVAVDLRKRMDPPLPQHCIGNIVHVAVANWEAKEVDYNGLAGKIHESISMINGEYVKQVYADGSFLQFHDTENGEDGTRS